MAFFYMIEKSFKQEREVGIMKTNRKKFTIVGIVLGIVVLLLAGYYTYVYFTTSPEEKAYNLAVQKIVEQSDERKNQSGENPSKSYLEEMAKEEEDDAQPYFDIYRKEYVSEEKEGYLVTIPVEEMRDEQTVMTYTYEVHVENKNGTLSVTSMERKTSE